ncbi:MAG: hypothetical protein WCT42_04290 [Candidatus Paceibacterota bacterium]
MHLRYKQALIFPFPWLVSIFLLVFVNGFSQNKQESNTKNLSFLAANELAVTLSYFDRKQIPDSLHGCSEEYAFDTLSFGQNKVILFTNLTTTAMLKINNRLLVFPITHTAIQGKKIITDFSAHGYQIRFTSTELKKINMKYCIRSGVLQIRKGMQKKVLYVLGNYGC